jgi:O-antigen/teichoic acid export membrane protein
MALGSRMARAAAGSMLYSVLANVMIYIGQITIARTLSRADYATFSVVVSLVSLIGMLADLGWTHQLIKRFAEAEAEITLGQTDRRGVILGTGLIAKLVLSILASILAVILSYTIYGPSLSYLVLIGIATFFLSSRLVIFRTVLESFARAEGKFDLVLKFGALDALFFGGLLYMWSQFGLSLTAVVAIYSFCHIPGFLLLIGYIRKTLKAQSIELTFDRELVKDLFVSSFPVTLGIGFLAIHNMADTLILERLSDDHQVSAYAASFRVMAGLLFLPMVLNGIVIPEFVKLLKQQDVERAEKLSRLSLQALISGAVFIALLISSLAPILVQIVLGEQYSDAWQLVIIFGWMFLPIVFSSIVLELSIAVGKQRLFGSFALVLAIVTVVGDLLVAKPYGAVGVTIVKFVAMIAGCAVIVNMSLADPILSKIFRGMNWGKNLLSLLIPVLILAGLSQLNVPTIVAGLLTAAAFLAWSIKTRLIDIELLSGLAKSFTKR